MKIAFYTLGCKVNQYESQALSEILRERGHEIVSVSEKADAYVINSCTVTKTGDNKSKKTARHFKNNNPNAIVALIGCFPQAFPNEAEKIDEVDIIVGNKDKKKVIELLEECFEKREKKNAVVEHTKAAQIEEMSICSFDERTRAFLKIQDGCNRFCSYCIIPKARGRICSKPVDQIKTEVAALVKNGHSEIVLVGIDLSSYGKEFGLTLTDAVEAVSQIEGVKRIRLGSLEPEIISDDDIKRLSKLPNFCPQFHLSLQSGCDKTLKDMNRHYTSDEYRQIVNKLRAAFPNASITTDVMVGFAGESEEDFKASLDFVCEMRFLKVHVFPYSVREGTRAAEFKNQTDPATKKERAHIMQQKTEQIRKEILNENIGRECEILIEGREKGGFSVGYTMDYIPVYVKDSAITEGSLVNVKINGIHGDGCLATILSEE